MLKWITCLLTIAFATEAPFWKSKEKVYERVQNGEIIVSVRETSGDAAKSDEARAKHTLVLSGGGQVAAPRSVVYAVALRYENLPKFSDYIRSVKVDRTTQTVTLEVSAFGYSTVMAVQVEPIDSEAESSVAYRIMSGPMKGLRGRVTMVSLPRNKTEVGLDGEFKYDEFPLPRLFIEFGMELAFRRLAWRLRTFAEEEFKNERALHP